MVISTRCLTSCSETHTAMRKRLHPPRERELEIAYYNFRDHDLREATWQGSVSPLIFLSSMMIKLLSPR
jgi:hypothetical protein